MKNIGCHPQLSDEDHLYGMRTAKAYLVTAVSIFAATVMPTATVAIFTALSFL